jgi:hypothetical protein
VVQEAFRKLAVKAGCKRDSLEDSVACLREASVSAIIRAADDLMKECVISSPISISTNEKIGVNMRTIDGNRCWTASSSPTTLLDLCKRENSRRSRLWLGAWCRSSLVRVLMEQQAYNR